MSLIGIFGGTFDPVHYGHLRTAREVYAGLGLAEVRFIPAFMPPHRQQPVASAQQRLQMVRLALENEPGFIVDDCEYRRNKPSYTVDTLIDFRKQDATLCLMIGADSLLTLPTWHRWQQIFELCHVIVMARPGYDIAAAVHTLPWLASRLCSDEGSLHETAHGCVLIQAVTEQAVSATAIRKAVAAGEPTEGMLPVSVAEYISREHLYS